ncbi:redoxin domain-containing protein [Natronorubrum bangense]|uniref:Alkyl hydroperoxide reductase/ thiol specific antioxidant/ Mal allergen n=2 Tax=Natronorubrum bangense TaxID=61858 RepID=L9WPL5_9EURY|nr:redoxin domain-containing protein [Natronorubrum bangense]ELY50288.1 alkyl hydroperoxide reductase/ thiol specific antioxidant/ Mal allergen [Natronorubrum bangense JCM 10635]QCC54269.1 peroxiredoxin [Natronorubrum bangense]
MPEFEVVDLGPTDHPTAGDEAPEFTRPLVTDEFWQDQTLSELVANGRTILVFTPMIGSFVGKYVWDELTERGWADCDEQVVGVTASTPYAISRFIDENDAPFTLFADPANGVADDYGIAHALDGMTGISEPRLAFFAVGQDCTVEAAWVATEWPEFPDYDALEERLGLV